MATDGKDRNTPDNRLGQTVENYRLTSILGTGGTSVVYIGQRLDDERTQVAVKVLTFPEGAGSADRAAFRTRFLRTARAVRKLRHDHILPVLSYGEEEDLTYIVMPLVMGGTLADRMTKTATPLPLAEIASYCQQLASALDYAHSQGIVHRDVKPSNVLLDPQGGLYLTDFGIARLFDVGNNALTAAGQGGLTQIGQVLGTPYYMAPEQIKGEPVGPAADIYALGIVIYQLVTGQVPYPGDSVLAVALKHVQEEPCPPSLLRSGLPPEVERAILKAMAKQPAERFASATELAEALERAVREAQGTAAQRTPNDTRTSAIRPVPSQGSSLSGDPYQRLVGTTLGSYLLERLLDVSDLGALFQARSGAEGAFYRLRVLAVADGQPAASRSIFVGRFQQLAHSVAELQHPYILPLLDYGSANVLPYLVAPYPAGPSLSERLGEIGPMELLAAGRFLDQLSAALEYAHEHSLLHRNLNAQCIYVEGSTGMTELHVADFEVRRMVELGSLAAQGSTLYHNTEACAPEQLQGKPVDTYTDVYALGVVLYAMLTGRPIFSGPTKDDIAQQHLYSSPPPLRRWRAGLPTALENIVARALAKEPEQRFRHPAELASAYRQIVGSASGSYTFGTSPAPAPLPWAAPPATPPAFVTPPGQQVQSDARGDTRVETRTGGRTDGRMDMGGEGNATIAATPVPIGPSVPSAPFAQGSENGAGGGMATVAERIAMPSGPAIPQGPSDGAASGRFGGSSGGNPGGSAGSPAAEPYGGSPTGAAGGYTPAFPMSGGPTPVYNGPGAPPSAPNRTSAPDRTGTRPPWRAARIGAAVATAQRRLGLPAWAIYVVTGVVLFALLFGFFLAAKGGGGILGGGAYADAQFGTPAGDVGYWANQSLNITASNLGAAPKDTRYVAWLEQVSGANAEPSKLLRLGELTKSADQDNVWTVTYKAKQYTNLMGEGNLLEIVEEDSTKPAPSTPDPTSVVVLTGTFPDASYQHLQHLLFKWPDTPEQAGFLPAMRHQTYILQGEAQALKEAAYRGDSFAVSCHAQSVLDIVEGKPGADFAALDSKCGQNHITDQLGDGYGFLGDNGQGKYTYEPYIAAVENHMNLAKQALGNSPGSLQQLTTHAPHVRDAMEHVKSVLHDAQQDALKLKQNPGGSGASDTAADLASKVDSALQYSGPEGATPDPSQYGVVDAFNHTEYAATLRLTHP